MRTLNLFLLFFFLFTLNSYSLPKCPGYDTVWDNCNGWINFSDGTIYSGEFKNDKFHGYGELWTAEGDDRDHESYEGEWKNGKRHGKGKEIYGINKKMYGRHHGEWKNGKRHGKFIITQGGGKRWECEYRNGRLQGECTANHIGDWYPEGECYLWETYC